jgi:hypothetical protein
VTPLRHSLSVLDTVREDVAVQQRDAMEMSCQDPGRQKPADACADDDGVIAEKTTGRWNDGHVCSSAWRDSQD